MKFNLSYFDSYFFLFFHIIFVPLRKSHQRHLFRRRNQLKAKVLTKERNLYEIFRATRSFLFCILRVLTRVHCKTALWIKLMLIIKKKRSQKYKRSWRLELCLTLFFLHSNFVFPQACRLVFSKETCSFSSKFTIYQAFFSRGLRYT